MGTRVEYKYGQLVELTIDIIEGYVVHALRGDTGEIVKPTWSDGWIVHMGRTGKLLRVTSDQITPEGL
jgi:ribosomal protein L21E